MAMNATTLTAAIKAAMVTNLGTTNPSILTNLAAQTDLNNIANAIATAVVAHIVANAQVTVTGTATGAQGGGAGVPVVGTGTIA